MYNNLLVIRLFYLKKKHQSSQWNFAPKTFSGHLYCKFSGGNVYLVKSLFPSLLDRGHSQNVSWLLRFGLAWECDFTDYRSSTLIKHKMFTFYRWGEKFVLSVTSSGFSWCDRGGFPSQSSYSGPSSTTHFFWCKFKSLYFIRYHWVLYCFCHLQEGLIYKVLTIFLGLKWPVLYRTERHGEI